MSYAVVTNWDSDKRYPAYTEKETEAEANKVLARVLPEDSKAFVVERPQGDAAYWLIDPDKKTASYLESEFDADKVKADAMSKIEELEAAISTRRMRDAFASDEGKKWMSDQEALIGLERAKL